MSTSPATTDQKQPRSVKEFLALPAYANRFNEVLGKRAPQFMASITNAVTQSTQLSRCEPRSVIAAAFVAASLDLPVDKNLGVCWIVPYGDQAQPQLGYRAFIQLALRSGQYARMNACPVNVEAFSGYDEVGEPVIDWSKLDETKPAAGYVAAWRLTNGFVKSVYWTREKVDAHAKRFSQAYRSKKKDTPWSTDFDAMAVKTVIKHGLSKWGILSIDLQRAMIHDQGAQRDIDAEVKHVDGALFDMGTSGSLRDALGDEPAKGVTIDVKATAPESQIEQELDSHPEPEQEQQKPEEKPAAPAPAAAAPEPEKHDVASADIIEGLLLDLNMSLNAALKYAREQNWPLPEKVRHMRDIPNQTLANIRAFLEAKKRTALPTS